MTCLASRHGHPRPPAPRCRRPPSGTSYSLTSPVTFDHPYADSALEVCLVQLSCMAPISVILVRSPSQLV